MQFVPAALLILLTLITPTAGQSFSVAPRRGITLPAQTADQHGNPFKIAGLSGVTHTAGGVFWACMDNSNKLIRFAVTLDEQGNVITARVMNGLTLEDRADNEGIALSALGENVAYVSDEATSILRRYDLATGKRLGAMDCSRLFPRIRPNFGLESLARSLDGTQTWTANEETLIGDGEQSTQQHGSLVRILRHDARTNALTQYAYEVDPIHGGPARGARSGLVDLVALPDGTILSLERSAANTGFRGRIYQLNFAGATDVSAMASLRGATFTPVKKTLLWKGVPGGMFGQNFEGLCLGPRLADGNWSLIGVVDSGDGLLSTNTVLAFELAGPLPSLAANVTLPPGRDWYFHVWSRNPSASQPQ